MATLKYIPIRDYLPHKLVGENIITAGGFKDSTAWTAIGANVTTTFDEIEGAVEIEADITSTFPLGGIYQELTLPVLGETYLISINVTEVENDAFLQLGISRSTTFQTINRDGYIQITEPGRYTMQWVCGSLDSYLQISVGAPTANSAIKFTDVWAKKNSEPSHDPGVVLNAGNLMNGQGPWLTGGTATFSWIAALGRCQIAATGDTADVFYPVPGLRHGVEYEITHVTTQYLPTGTGNFNVSIGNADGPDRNDSQYGTYTDRVVADLFGLAAADRVLKFHCNDINPYLGELSVRPVSNTQYTLEFDILNNGYTSRIDAVSKQLVSIGGAVSTTFSRNDYRFQVTTGPLDEGALPNFREMWASAASGQFMTFDAFSSEESGLLEPRTVLLETKSYRERPLGSGFWQVSFVLRDIR